jgi:phosphosulfolactate synthase
MTGGFAKHKVKVYLNSRARFPHRVQSYRKNKIHVSNGGTLLEICVSKGKEDLGLHHLLSCGFDTIELSEGVLEISPFIKQKISEFAHSHGLRLHVEVGRKNPRNQLSLEDTVLRIEQSFDYNPDSIIIEGRESGKSVGIYDDEGRIKWNWVEALQRISKSSKLMFEAPQEIQQTELILHVGADVNLGNIAMPSLAALETQRQGLRGDTFGVPLSSTKVEGGPAAKFLFFVIASQGAADQSKLMRLTGLNRRTAQESLKKLVDQGLIKESLDTSDLRKRVYSV